MGGAYGGQGKGNSRGSHGRVALLDRSYDLQLKDKVSPK